jgi:DNA-binding NarL/FixJ family response regulator
VSGRPRVVIVDDHHLFRSGVRAELGEELDVVAERGVPVRFLALSVSDAAEDVIAVIRAGARGYVAKTISADDLAQAVRSVAGGDAVFSPRLAGFVLDAFAADRPAAPGGAGAAELEGGQLAELDVLTPRETVRDYLRVGRSSSVGGGFPRATGARARGHTSRGHHSAYTPV